jgi:methyl-accepting chemotaxis protein
MVKNMRFRTKLILGLFIVGLIPFVISAVFLTNMASQAIEKQVYNHLVSMRDSKKLQITHYFESVFSELKIISQSKGGTSDLFDALRKYRATTDSTDEGPFMTVTSEYEMIYEKFGKNIKQFYNQKGFYDMFLICAEHGHVMFSCTRESDMGTNLKHGPYKNSGLAKLWKQVVATRDISIADFEPYAPSNNEPACFVGIPIKNFSGRVEGVIAAQLSLDTINYIMQQRTGMGESGETYLVGSDKLMRSDSFLDPANHSIKASFANPVKGSVNTEASTSALAGNTGEKIITDYRGAYVLSAFTPVNLGKNITWALLAEIDKKEAFQAISKFKGIALVIGVALVFAIFACAYFMGVSMTKPVSQATNELKTAAEEINVAAQQQLTSTTEQATSTTQINTTIDELVYSSKQISQTAKEVSISSNKVFKTAQKGNVSLDEAVEGIGIVEQQVEKVVEHMLSLGEKSQQMNLALDIIKELSEQTTILSYNATIEAAGAGESGRRFSAIAEQVMKLANKATDSSKDIKIMIDDMQKSSNQTVLATEDGMKAAREGKRRIEISRKDFDSILSLSQTNVSQSKEIDMTLAQQFSSIAESAEGIKNIEVSSEEIKTSSNQTLVTADQLVDMANKLVEI